MNNCHTLSLESKEIEIKSNKVDNFVNTCMYKGHV